ncbi:MAG: NADPH-dependent FMN reductase [Myxococcales bacterium]|nr:MAG: NADPH-dependent FMN reductase [Myxococcales bacterium]
MHVPKAREGQAPGKLSRPDFSAKFRERFDDPAFAGEHEAIARLEQIAWDTYQAGRKSPRVRLAGPGFADPSYELSVEWLATRDRLALAAEQQADPARPPRVLVVIGSPRNDGTCPSEASKTWRLAEVARRTLEGEKQCDVDVLDLSLLTSTYGTFIHPCKGCVSTAMPLCHWPCSCYPNHSLDQTNDAMGDIYVKWVRAHAVLLVTPVHWYQAPTVLKAMIDRLVCADGGNPDPTSTHGKKPEEAKAIELKGWDYPRHLAGRAYGVVVHGDAAGTEALRRVLVDWLDTMGLVRASPTATLDRYIDYYGTYAGSHEALDRDDPLFDEVRNVARSVADAVTALRRGEPLRTDTHLREPRDK